MMIRPMSRRRYPRYHRRIVATSSAMAQAAGG
jgi:hypothetical protein